MFGGKKPPNYYEWHLHTFLHIICCGISINLKWQTKVFPVSQFHPTKLGKGALVLLEEKIDLAKFVAFPKEERRFSYYLKRQFGQVRSA
jgi:hypothetical protein